MCAQFDWAFSLNHRAATPSDSNCIWWCNYLEINWEINPHTSPPRSLFSCERNFNHLNTENEKEENISECAWVYSGEIKCSREFIICDRKAVKIFFFALHWWNLFKFLKTWIYLSEMWWQGKLAKRTRAELSSSDYFFKWSELKDFFMVLFFNSTCSLFYYHFHDRDKNVHRNASWYLILSCSSFLHCF
jgi:hypothetical protein